VGIKIEGLKEVINYLNKLFNDTGKKAYIEKLTERGYQLSKRAVSRHTKTGRMERNLTKRVRGNTGEIFFLNQGMIKGGVNYALFVHYGTRPHSIYPKNKKALRWKSGGKFVFAKRVNHPGYKGDPFFDRVQAQLENEAPNIFYNTVEKE